MATNPFQGDDVDPFSAMRDEEGNIKKMSDEDVEETLRRAPSGMYRSEEAPAAAAAPTSFKDAFAAARRAGGKTFEWQGKKYTTEMAGGKKAAPAPTPAPAAPAAPKAKQSIYDTSRDPLIRRVKESMAEREELARQRKETDAESARFAKRSTPVSRDRDPYRGRTAEQRVKDLRGYAGGGKVTASSRADGCAKRGKTKGKMY